VILVSVFVVCCLSLFCHNYCGVCSSLPFSASCGYCCQCRTVIAHYQSLFVVSFVNDALPLFSPMMHLIFVVACHFSFFVVVCVNR
jgi:hypothetical protein